ERHRPLLRGDPPGDRRLSRQLSAGAQPPCARQRCRSDSRRRLALAVLDLEREPRQPLEDCAVELFLVELARVVVERPFEVVADVGQDLGAGLDGVDVVAVALLGLVARCGVVRALELFALFDHGGVLALEEFELPRDHLAEAAAPEHLLTLARLWHCSSAPGTSFTATRSRRSATPTSSRWCGSPARTVRTSSACRSCPSGRSRTWPAGAA